MKIYMIAHEGRLENAAIVRANDPCDAAVRYYEAARACGLPYGDRGHKAFTIGAMWSHCIPHMTDASIHHYADVSGFAYLSDITPIDDWASYGLRQAIAS